MPESLVVVVVVVVDDDDDNDDVVAAAADAAILVVMGDAFERYDNVMIINAIFCYQRYLCIIVSIIMTRLSFYCFTIIPSSSSFFCAQIHVVGMLRFMSVTNQPSLPTPFYSVLVSI